MKHVQQVERIHDGSLGVIALSRLLIEVVRVVEDQPVRSLLGRSCIPRALESLVVVAPSSRCQQARLNPSKELNTRRDVLPRIVAPRVPPIRGRDLIRGILDELESFGGHDLGDRQHPVRRVRDEVRNREKLAAVGVDHGLVPGILGIVLYLDDVNEGDGAVGLYEVLDAGVVVKLSVEL